MAPSSNNTLDLARHALQRSPWSVLRDLEVEQAGDSLVIRGRVDKFYYKQLAQETVRAVCHEVELLNTVDVTPTSR